MAVGIGDTIERLSIHNVQKEPVLSRRGGHLFSNVKQKMSGGFTCHETKSVTEYLSDLRDFLEKRLGKEARLPIPQVYNTQVKTKDELVLQLKSQGFTCSDWLTGRLTAEEVEETVQQIALLHAAGLAFRTSMKKSLEEKYPWLEQDIYTSYQSKELLAKYLDSYLHYLSLLPGVEQAVAVLRKFKPRIFHLLVNLRKPSDSLGRRFRTVCHGDLWMGSLMFRRNKENKLDTAIIDFHSTGYLSPASDLAHLMLSSTDSRYMINNWDKIVEAYYNAFSLHLANLGIVLRHLGTTKQHFIQEVRRALAGELLCLAVVTPILVMCGPRQRRKSTRTSERENTVRHLIQMMAIAEIKEGEEGEGDRDQEEEEGGNRIADEWAALHRDDRLRSSVVDLLVVAQELGVLEEFALWSKVEASGSTGRRRTKSL